MDGSCSTQLLSKMMPFSLYIVLADHLYSPNKNLDQILKLRQYFDVNVIVVDLFYAPIDRVLSKKLSIQ